VIEGLLDNQIFLVLGVNFFLSLLLFFWGMRLPVSGRWLALLSLFLVFTVGFYQLLELMNGRIGESFWSINIIDFFRRGVTVSVGLMQDLYSLTVIIGSSIVCMVVVISKEEFVKLRYGNRLYAGILMGLSSVGLAWISATPWVAFLSLGFTLMAAVVSMSAYWGVNDSVAVQVKKYLLDHSIGMLFILAGICLGSVSALPLTFNLESHGVQNSRLDYAAALILFGVLLSFRPTPLLDWIRSKLEVSTVVIGLLLQVFTTFTAMVFLIRFEPVFRPLPMFETLGWVAVILAVLTLLTGYFQKDARCRSLALFPSLCALAFVGIVFGDLIIGFVFFLLLSIGYMGLTFCLDWLDSGGNITNEKKSFFLQLTLWVVFLELSFIPIFGTSTGVLVLIDKVSNAPLLLGVILFTLVLYLMSVWKIGLELISASRLKKSKGVIIFPVLIMLGLGLGIFWSGRISGGILFLKVDHIMSGLLVLLGSRISIVEKIGLGLAPAIYGGVLFVGIISSFLVRKYIKEVPKLLNGCVNIIRYNFYVDRIPFHGFRKMGDELDKRTTRSVFGGDITQSFETGILPVSRTMNRLSLVIENGLESIFCGVFRVTGKALRVLQNGNLQWYLFIIASTMVGILVCYFWGRN